MGKRRTYRINADRWDVLRDILVGTPEEFNPDSASLRGRETTSHDIIRFRSVGRLPQGERNDLFDRVVDYIIYSYDTPIAYRYVTHWEMNGVPVYGWCVPDVRYSVTTSKHQGKVRTAVSQIS